MRLKTFAIYLIPAFFAATALMLLRAPDASAQSKRMRCDIVDEAILKMNAPDFRGQVAWRRILGGEGADSVVAITPLEDKKQVFFITQSLKAGGKVDFSGGLMDLNGRVLSQKPLEVGALNRIEESAAAINMTAIAGRSGDVGEATQLILMNSSPQIAGRHTFKEEGAIIRPTALVPYADKGFLVGLQRAKRGGADDARAILAYVDRSGKVVWQRTFMPGTTTTLEAILPSETKSGAIWVAGTTVIEKRATAFLAAFDKNGGLMWQHLFRRGRSASLTTLAADPQGFAYAGGTIYPSDSTDGLPAGWLMRLDFGGNPMWNLYLQGESAYEAKAVRAPQDGFVNIYMQSRPTMDKKGRYVSGKSFVRAVRVSSEGHAIQQAVYDQGEGLSINIFGDNLPGTKLMLAGGQVLMPTEDKTADQTVKGQEEDGWLAGLPAFPAYDNPCLSE